MAAPDRRSIADPEQPSCLVLHGLGGGRYELEPIIAALEFEELRVSAPILPGHDGPGPIMPSSCWRDWADAAESAFDDLAAEGAPVVVLGFSTGATLALYLAGRRPVARQVLMAPFLAIRYSGLIRLHPATYIRFLARFKPDLPRRRPAVRDPAMRRQAARLDRFRTFNLNAALSALDLIEKVKAIVPQITTPTLILQGRLDTVIEPGQAAWIHRSLGSARKSLVILPGSDHLVALDRDRQQVIARTRAFVLGREDLDPGPGIE